MRRLNFIDKESIMNRSLQSSSVPNTMFGDFPDQILGGGYSTDMQMATFPCLNIDNVAFKGNSTSIVPFGGSISFDQFLAQLIPSAVNNNLWMFSANPEATFVQYSNDTVYTQSFYFSEFIVLPNNVFTPSGNGTTVLNPFGLGAHNAGPDQFRAICGDMVAIQEQLAAGLFVTLQMQFNRLADKATFNSKAGPNFTSISDAYNTIQSVTNQNNINGYLEFLVFQSGGNATELGQILSNNPATGTYYLTTCGFSSMSNCQGVINGVLSYASNNFKNQVGFQNGQVVGNAISIGFTYMNYTDLGLTVGNSVITPAIEATIDELEGLYLNMQPPQVLIDKILSEAQTYPYFNPNTNALFSNYNQAATHNSALISDPISGITGCYLTPANCLVIISNINSQLMPINFTQISDEIDVFQVGYSVSYSCNSITIPGTFLPIGGNMYFPFNVPANIDDTYPMMLPRQIVETPEGGLNIGYYSMFVDLPDRTMSLSVTPIITCNIGVNFNNILGGVVNPLNTSTPITILNQTSSGNFQGEYEATNYMTCNPSEGILCTMGATVIDSGIL